MNWSAVESIDLEKINSDVMPGAPTIDVGIYFPSNLDSQFDKVTLEQVVKGFLSAKDIYKPTGVQLNLLWLKTGVVDERFLSIQANEVPGVPRTEYVNMYRHMERTPSQLTKEARLFFKMYSFHF